MVQLKDDASDTSESSMIAQKAPKRLGPVWPYFLVALAVALIGTGVYHVQQAHQQNRCPFGFPSKKGPPMQNPHISDQKRPDTNGPPDITSPDLTLGDTADLEESGGALVYGSKEPLAEKYSGRVISGALLASHGAHSGDPWVAVLGQVYDVTKGIRHYGNDGTYSFFAGRDGSRAYSTGQFDEQGLTDDVADLSPDQIGEIYHWINIFGKKYRFVGRLEGRFFAADGRPRSSWRQIEDSLLRLGETEANKKALRRKYPSCNSHYDGAAGKAEVWCSERSGGVTRDWVGYPRQLHLPGQNVRCACGNPVLLPDPKLKPYPDCPADATSCKLVL